MYRLVLAIVVLTIAPTVLAKGSGHGGHGRATHTHQVHGTTPAQHGFLHKLFHRKK